MKDVWCVAQGQMSHQGCGFLDETGVRWLPGFRGPRCPRHETARSRGKPIFHEVRAEKRRWAIPRMGQVLFLDMLGPMAADYPLRFDNLTANWRTTIGLRADP
jgi:hypothetical protein